MTSPASPTPQALSVPEAAQQRRSIRVYQQRPIPEADLRQILTLAGRAPSAFNLQPWRFVVVREEGLKKRLHEAAYRQPQVLSAPAVIVLYTDMAETLANVEEVLHPGMAPEAKERTKSQILGGFSGQPSSQQESWAAGQGYIALGYLLLAAQSLGYVTSPMGGFEPAKVKEVLELPEHVSIPALVAIGEAAEEGYPPFRHPLERIVSLR